MAIQLGENPWVLIGLTLLEILFIILPAFISSIIENKSFKEEAIEMGFQKNENIFIKIIGGISFGVLFYFSGGLIIILFRNIIIENLLGSEFVTQGQEGAISTTPFQPNLIQILVIIILQIIIIGPCEEAFFRGFIINKLKKKLNLAYSTIISSIFFTFYHLPPFLVPITTVITFFGYYFIFSVFLAILFIYFKYSLIPCSIAHSCFNIFILIV